MKVTAKLNNVRISPRKIRLVANFIKGLDVDDAIQQIDAKVKKGDLEIKKLLLSAVANAENNFGIDRNNMYVSEILVGAGSTLKRWMPKAYGRAGAIRKRTSKIILTVDERIEGKGRKSKEELEKERKARLEAKKKLQKEMEAQEQENKQEEKKEISKLPAKEADKVKKAEGKGNWTSKIFRRKSM